MTGKFAYNLRAILYGVAANLAAAMVGGTVLMAVYLRGALPSDPADADMERLQALLLSDGGFLAASFLLGGLSTALGGYVAARMAPYSKLVNAACTGAVDAVLGLMSGGAVPLWLRLGAVAVALPAAIYGGYLAKYGLSGKAGEG